MSSIKKAVLKKLLGEAGAGLEASMGGAVEANSLRKMLSVLVSGLSNRLLYGMEPAAPTTASTQATGAGNTAWRVNISTGKQVVSSVQKIEAAQADFVIFSGANIGWPTGGTGNGQVIAAVIEKNVAGTLSTDKVVGTVTAAGLAVAPTDAQISAALGSAVSWVRLFNATLNRTADTTVTQTQDATVADVGVEVTIE